MMQNNIVITPTIILTHFCFVFIESNDIFMMSVMSMSQCPCLCFNGVFVLIVKLTINDNFEKKYVLRQAGTATAKPPSPMGIRVVPEENERS